MTKRTHYTSVSWHGPRCSMSKKWVKEIHPIGMSYNTPRPPAPGSNKINRIRNTAATTIDNERQGRNIENVDSRNSSECVDTFLDVKHWPTKSYSKIGQFSHSRMRKRLTRKIKNYSSNYSSRYDLPPMDQTVGGTVIKIGNTFLPTISRRMR